MTTDVIFKHGTTKSNHRFTLGIVLGAKQDIAHVSVALCSSKNQFNKERGRIITTARIEKNKRGVRPFVIDTSRPIRESLSLIFDGVASKSKRDLVKEFGLYVKKPCTAKKIKHMAAAVVVEPATLTVES